LTVMMLTTPETALNPNRALLERFGVARNRDV